MQALLCFDQCEIAFGRTRGGDDTPDKLFRFVDEDACRPPAPGQALDPPAVRIRRVGGDPGSFKGKAVAPRRVIVGPLKPDRTVRHDRVEFRRGGEATEAPDLLVPAASKDPRPGGVFLGKRPDRVQSLFERLRFRQIERHSRKAIVHDMEMRVDHARQHDGAFGIEKIVHPLGSVVPAIQHGDNPPVVADMQCGEPVDLAVFVDANTIDVFDQLIGRSRFGNRQKGDTCEKSGKRAHNHSSLFVIRCERHSG